MIKKINYNFDRSNAYLHPVTAPKNKAHRAAQITAGVVIRIFELIRAGLAFVANIAISLANKAISPKPASVAAPKKDALPLKARLDSEQEKLPQAKPILPRQILPRQERVQFQLNLDTIPEETEQDTEATPKAKEKTEAQVVAEKQQREEEKEANTTSLLTAAGKAYLLMCTAYAAGLFVTTISQGLADVYTHRDIRYSENADTTYIVDNDKFYPYNLNTFFWLPTYRILNQETLKDVLSFGTRNFFGNLKNLVWETITNHS